MAASGVDRKQLAAGELRRKVISGWTPPDVRAALSRLRPEGMDIANRQLRELRELRES